MDANEFVTEYFKDVQYAARKASHQSAVIDQEDIEQSIWEALLKEPKILEANRKVVITAIDRKARLHAEKESIDYMYFSCAYVYNPDMIRNLLADVVWCPAEECLDVDARLDLRNAFTELARRKPAQARAVFRRFGLGEDYSKFTGGQKANESFGIDFIAQHLNKRAPVKSEDLDEVVNAGIV